MRRILPALAAWSLAAASLAAADEGEKIYRRLCLSCHGPNGEGTKEHSDPLFGDRPLDKLAQYIDKKMPEGAPEKLDAEGSRKVAAYIYDAFYSPIAQARIRPARIELARLTEQQYRNALADLFGAFAPRGRWEEGGLRGEYFRGGRRFRDDFRVVDRIDPVVRFDFGEWSPAEGIYADEFGIRWEGSIFIPDTGEYEFNVETRNGHRLAVNALDRPVIDGWVRSGNDLAHRGSIFLLGGRAYPLRLEFFKAPKEKLASVALKWKRPHRAEELVPPSHLSPARFPEVFVASTPFPPDDRSMGYERGTNVSKAWDEATTHAALEAAAYALARIDALGGSRKEACHRLVEHAFRQPLTTAEREFFVDRFFSGGDPDGAVKRVVLLALKSPRFLFHAPTGADAYDVASRLSFALWDSIPDRELLEAAKAGRLSAPAEVSAQVARMMPDPRTRAKLRDFLQEWLQVDRLQELSKDAKLYPEFNEAFVADLRTSLDLFLDDVVWSDGSDFRQLLLADYVYLNGRLGRFYGADLPADAPFRKATLGAGRHAGILTHPLLMAGFAYDATSSPIHRGVFVARSFLGRRLRPPPEAVTPLPPTLHPGLSTRERIALQTRPQACQSCHGMINPLGFALENFDAAGRFRKAEQGKAIDASGSYWTLGGETVTFNGGRELGEYLARSEETHAAFVEQLFHAIVKQPIRAHGTDRPDEMRKYFVENGYSIRKLLARTAEVSALSGALSMKGKTR